MRTTAPPSPQSRRPLRGAAAALLTCSLLALSAPAATAKDTHAKVPPKTSEAAAPAVVVSEAQAPATTGTVEAPPVRPKRVKAGAKGAPAGEDASGSTEAGATSEAPVPAKPTHPAKTGTGTKAKAKGKAKGKGASADAVTQGGEAETEAASETTLVSTAKKSGGSGASTGRVKVKHDKPKTPKHELKTPKPITTPAATTPVETATEHVSSPVAPAAGIATASTAASGPETPSVVAEASSPTTGGSAAAAGHHGHKAARRAPGAGTAGLAAPAAAAIAAAATSHLAGGPHGNAHAANPKAPPTRTSTPLVTSVTRFIDVVPLAVRVIIAALVALALALAASSRLTAVRARRLARQRGQLLEDVGLLQAALLPALPERIGPVATTAAYHPASGPGAGGDFYDVFALADGRVAVIVGDVSGHGRAALPHTALLRFTMRAYLEAGLTPRLALQTAAPVLERQLSDSLATVVLAVYHPRERTLVYAAAGHPHPLVMGAETVEPITVCSAPPIGTSHRTGTRQTTVSIPGGSLACFYTDGLVESRIGGDLYGTDRLLNALAGLGPDAGATELLDRVAKEADRRPDDMAACVLRIAGDADAPPKILVEELELDREELDRGRIERFLAVAGFAPAEADEVLRAVRSSLAHNERVLLEMHLGGARPEVIVHPQNVSVLQTPLRASARAGGM